MRYGPHSRRRFLWGTVTFAAAGLGWGKGGKPKPTPTPTPTPTPVPSGLVPSVALVPSDLLFPR